MMKRRIQHAVFATLGLLCVQCGLITAGTWEDDPGNWARAFDSTKPPNVVVIHSKYWRSAHWSYEYQYFFEIIPTADLRGQIFTRNKLRRLTNGAAHERRRDVLNAPAWFAPKAPEEYDVWSGDRGEDDHLVVLVDKATGHMFLTDYLA